MSRTYVVFLKLVIMNKLNCCKNVHAWAYDWCSGDGPQVVWVCNWGSGNEHQVMCIYDWGSDDEPQVGESNIGGSTSDGPHVVIKQVRKLIKSLWRDLNLVLCGLSQHTKHI